MAREPTDRDLATLRSLLHAAGSEAALHRWIKLAKQVPKGKAGRPRGTTKYIDEEILGGLQALIAVAAQERAGWGPKRTINSLLKGIKGKGDPDRVYGRLVGESHQPWKRLNKKLKAGGFKTFADLCAELWPNMDVSKLTLEKAPPLPPLPDELAKKKSL